MEYRTLIIYYFNDFEFTSLRKGMKMTTLSYIYDNGIILRITNGSFLTSPKGTNAWNSSDQWYKILLLFLFLHTM